jgi:hypothetical protein
MRVDVSQPNAPIRGKLAGYVVVCRQDSPLKKAPRPPLERITLAKA